MLVHDMEHVIKLHSKGKISVWTDKDLKYTDLKEPHQKQIFSGLLDHILEIKQNTDGPIRL